MPTAADQKQAAVFQEASGPVLQADMSCGDLIMPSPVEAFMLQRAFGFQPEENVQVLKQEEFSTCKWPWWTR